MAYYDDFIDDWYPKNADGTYEYGPPTFYNGFLVMPDRLRSEETEGWNSDVDGIYISREKSELLDGTNAVWILGDGERSYLSKDVSELPEGFGTTWLEGEGYEERSFLSKDNSALLDGFGTTWSIDRKTRAYLDRTFLEDISKDLNVDGTQGRRYYVEMVKVANKSLEKNLPVFNFEGETYQFLLSKGSDSGKGFLCIHDAHGVLHKTLLLKH